MRQSISSYGAVSLFTVESSGSWPGTERSGCSWRCVGRHFGRSNEHWLIPRQSGGFRYICPAQWDEEERFPPVSRLTDGRLVLATEGRVYYGDGCTLRSAHRWLDRTLVDYRRRSWWKGSRRVQCFGISLRCPNHFSSLMKVTSTAICP